VNLKGSGEAPLPLPMTPFRTCKHSRIISDLVSEDEHNGGKVRCVECGSIVPDPYLQREATTT
jgi:hypothetical protein